MTDASYATAVGSPFTMPSRRVVHAVGAEVARALLFLGGSFVFGLLWFVVLVPMLAVGLSLTFIGIGFPLVLFAISVLLTASQLERQRVAWFTGRPLAAAYQPVTGLSWWRRMGVRIRDWAVWRDAIYLFLLLPLGAAELALAVGVVGVTASFLFAPAYFWIAGDGLHFGIWVVDTLPGAMVASVVGVLLIGPGAAMLVSAAQGHSALARALLGPSPTEQLTARVEELHRSRAGIIEAQLAERRRIERDLHDGAQQRLVALAMDLGMARESFEAQPERTRELIERSHAEAKQVLADLRQLVRGIHPAVLTDRGLDAAISAIAGRMAIPVTVDVRLEQRLPERLEIAAYFVVLEALTNITKHAAARHAWVTIRRDADLLRVEVMDDGAGGATLVPGGGLDGLRERVAALDGMFRLVSPPGGPTRVRADLPCAS